MDSALPSDPWIRELLHLGSDLAGARSMPDPAHLVSRALELYASHYRARADLSRSDPLSALLPPTATPLERAAHWISGWRPNLLIHLLYTESGLKFEAQLEDLLSGTRSGDLGDISPARLARIDELQRQTIRSEIEIDEEMGKVQVDVGDSDSDLDRWMERMAGVVVRADELRMRMLRAVVEILDPLQATDLLTAVVDLEVGLRGLGLELQKRPIVSSVSWLGSSAISLVDHTAKSYISSKELSRRNSCVDWLYQLSVD